MAVVTGWCPSVSVFSPSSAQGGRLPHPGHFIMNKQQNNIAGPVLHLAYEDTCFCEYDRIRLEKALVDGIVPCTFPESKVMVRELLKLEACVKTVTACVASLDSEDSMMLIQLFYLRYVIARKAFGK